MDRKRRAVLCGGLVLALAWLRTDAGAQPLRELTEAEAIAAATAPIDLSHLQDRTILGTLKGHALIEEYLCNGSCDKGAYRVVQLDLGGGKYLDYCEEWGGKWFELPTGPGRQKPFCIPPAVRDQGRPWARFASRERARLARRRWPTISRPCRRLSRRAPT